MSAKKILLIDDDQQLLLGLKARLKANGYNVVTAMDGMSATQMAIKEVPDLIILDLGLPAGDGFVVLERLKGLADCATTPVIVLSAKNPADNRQRALNAGAIAFFQKPPDNRVFLNAIQRALGETGALSSFLKT